MIVSGDEYGRTQNGNNNPWCIDTIGIWNNWAMAGSNAPQQVPVDPDHPDLHYHDNLGQGLTPDGVNPLLRFTRACGNGRTGMPCSAATMSRTCSSARTAKAIRAAQTAAW